MKQQGNCLNERSLSLSAEWVRSSFLLRAVLGCRSPSARRWAGSSPDRWRHSHAKRAAQPCTADGASQTSDGNVKHFWKKQQKHRYDFPTCFLQNGLTYLLGGQTTIKKKENRGGAYCAFIFTTQNIKSRMLCSEEKKQQGLKITAGRQRQHASGMKPEKTAVRSYSMYTESDGALLKKIRTDSMTWKKRKNKRSNKKQVCIQSETKKAMQVTPRVFTESKERVTAALIVEWKSGSVFFCLCVSTFLAKTGCRWLQTHRYAGRLFSSLSCWEERRKKMRKKEKTTSSGESAQNLRLKRDSGPSP